MKVCGLQAPYTLASQQPGVGTSCGMFLGLMCSVCKVGLEGGMRGQKVAIKNESTFRRVSRKRIPRFSMSRQTLVLKILTRMWLDSAICSAAESVPQ